jgi:arginyl-tRNA synthetase
MLTPIQQLQRMIASALAQLFSLERDPLTINIKIAPPQFQCHYTSTIAMAIAPLLPNFLPNLDFQDESDTSPLQIAKAIANFCQQSQQSSQYLISVPDQSRGWLNIDLQPAYLAKILLDLDRQKLTHLEQQEGFWARAQLTTSLPSAHTADVDDSQFSQIQYAYARCCGLMRLAYSHIDSPLALAMVSPPQILWSDRYEINLLLHNLAIVDHLQSAHQAYTDPQLTRHLRQSLGQSFLEFFDHCRIIGVTPAAAYTRSILARITQKHFLAIAPTTYAMYL